MNIKEAIKQKILILDGAMGTMIQSYNLSEKDFRGKRFENIDGQMTGNNDMLNITNENVILDIHRRYLKAGADLIETNTFSSQRISQADYGLEDYCYEMALCGAKIARNAADEFSTIDKPRYVLGSIGPTNKTCSMSADVSNPASREINYDVLFNAYSEEVGALIDGGVDAIIIETIFDTLNAKTAIDASITTMNQKGIILPIMISVTISDLAGRTLSGQTLDAFLSSIDSYDIFSVGINCGFGAQQMEPYLRELAKKAPYYISAYPNAGLPNSMGLYDETPETMTPKIAKLIDEGLANIIGGCCGTTDEFISQFAKVAIGKKPHIVSPHSTTLQLSGLDPLNITQEINFVNVGERCNVAGSRKFLRCIEEKRYDDAAAIARKEVEDGALVIDINMDAALLDAKNEMVNFLNLITSDPDIARVPVMIDSSKWDVIVAALKCLQGKSIVNSISLKEGEDIFISHAKDVKRYGAACVVMCFDELGQATTYERRIEIAKRAYDILTKKVGMNPLNIIFDPNILAIATGLPEHDNYAVDFIKATKWIRQNLYGSHVSGGVSNLSFSFRGNNYIRESMHAVFLYHAIQAGMDFGIVNPASKITYSDIPEEDLNIIEDVVLNRREGASDKLIELANEIKEKSLNEKAVKDNHNNIESLQSDKDHWRHEDIEKRLSYALRRGINDYLEADLHEALNKYSHAVDIIEGPLMDGMNIVGSLFGEGKMFLPQVVKTARTMKQAVGILQPYIEADKKYEKSKAGLILLATVKGDVHDIGKNIVAVVMACNNYDVIDLGVMVPAEQIVKKAIELKADIVGLSGLITPSLEEMVNVATVMQRAGLNIPIMIGGATTSQLHVALKIAPIYDGPVIWMKDASQNPIVAAKLLNKDEKDIYINELNKKHEELRYNYQNKKQNIISLEEARKNKLKLF
jgi:5-methyltetrahydrofolate--homocysteine methyltransferase